LRDGLRVGLLPGEETLTDLNLITMKRSGSPHLYAVKHSRAQESRSGADFELWIGSAGDWRGLRIQAKKINPSTGGFDEFTGGAKRKKAISQAADLIFDSNRPGEPTREPMYCFYNYWEAKSPSAPTVRRDASYGCAVASAFAVLPNLAAGESRLGALSPILPWERLVCDGGGKRSLADVANDAIDEIVPSTAVFRSEPTDLPEEIAWLREVDAVGEGAQAEIDQTLERLKVRYAVVVEGSAEQA
jgi:hypothetical protein